MPHLVHAVAGGVGFLLFLAVAVLTVSRGHAAAAPADALHDEWELHPTA
jgi:hypothetical protein